jgi:hypothetical protein
VEFLRRTGDDIKAESQRLIDELRDPEKHQMVRESLNDLSTWARRTAEEAQGFMNNAMERAENAFERVAERGQAVADKVVGRRKTTPTRATAAKRGGGKQARRTPAKKGTGRARTGGKKRSK